MLGGELPENHERVRQNWAKQSTWSDEQKDSHEGWACNHKGAAHEGAVREGAAQEVAHEGGARLPYKK